MYVKLVPYERSLEDFTLLFLLHLVIKVRALILVNKLGEPLSRSLSSSTHRIRICVVRKAQVKMVRRVLNIYGHSVIVDFASDATCMPRIQITVSEDDV